MRWQVKCVLDGLKAILPFQDHLRRAKRAVCGMTPTPERDRLTIRQGVEQLRSIQAVFDIRSACVLEVGSGWQPLIPLLYSAAGARQVIMTDLRPLLHLSSLRAAVDSFRANADLVQDSLKISSNAFEEFLRRGDGDDLQQSLSRLGLRYLAPCDVRRTGLPPASIDAVVSRAVLEHIPPDVVRGIFSETVRLLKPGGVACHIIDNSDHWQHEDKSISRVNFLKFSDSVFRWTCINGLNYQNRLRHSEYRRILEDVGLTIERDEGEVDTESRRLLESFPLAPAFRHFTEDDLATITSFFLARKATG